MKKKKLVLSVSLLASLFTVGNLASCSKYEGKETEIIFWHCLGHDKTASLNKLVDAFNADHKDKDGYSVKLIQLNGDYAGLHDTVKTKLQAGYTPAITMGYPDSFSEYIGTKGADKSRILKLDDFIKNDSTFKEEDFVAAFYDEGKHFQYEGTWCMPMYKSTEVMYINKNMWEATDFYKANKDKLLKDIDSSNSSKYVQTAKVGNPNTWDWNSLVYIGSKIQEELNPDGSKDFYSIGYDSDSNLFITQMEQRGIEYTSDKGEKADHIKFVTKDSKTVNSSLVDFATEFLDLADKKILATQGTYGSYASDNFLKKKVMFTIGSTGGSTYNDPHGSTNAGFDAAIYPVPCYNGNYKFIQQGPDVCFFPQKDENKQKATWDFYTNYLSSIDYNTGLALANSYDPVKNAAFETEEYKNWIVSGDVNSNETIKLDNDGNPITNLNTKMDKRIPALTKQMRQYYMTTPVFYGSSTVRSELGNVLKYAKAGDKNKTNREKIEAAILKAYNTMITKLG